MVDSIEALWAEFYVSLPGQADLQALPALKKRLPGTDIILQVMHDNPERIFPPLWNRATGFIIKNATSLP